MIFRAGTALRHVTNTGLAGNNVPLKIAKKRKEKKRVKALRVTS